MRMKCLRIFPETIPRISCSELSSLSLNIALGNAVVTVASTSIGSDLGTIRHSAGLSDEHSGRVSTRDERGMVLANPPADKAGPVRPVSVAPNAAPNAVQC